MGEFDYVRDGNRWIFADGTILPVVSGGDGTGDTAVADPEPDRVEFVLDAGRLAAVSAAVDRLAGPALAAGSTGAACRMGMHTTCSMGSCACGCHSTGMNAGGETLAARLAGLTVQAAARAGLLRSSECLADRPAECTSRWCGSVAHDDGRFSATGEFDCGDLDPDTLTACLQCGCISDDDDTFCSRCGSKLPSVPADGMSPVPSRVASAAPATLARQSDECQGGDHADCGFPACACDCHDKGGDHAAEVADLAAGIVLEHHDHAHVEGEPCSCGGTCDRCEQLAAAATVAAIATAPTCACARFTSLDAEGLCGHCGGRLSTDRRAALATLGLVEAAVSDVVEAAAVRAPAPPIDPHNPGRFSAVLLTEEEQTGDGRVIAKGATTWRPLPLTLMYQPENLDGHTGAVPVGTIEKIVRKGLQVVGEGTWDTSETALECARLVRDGVVTGISIDGGDVEAEIEMQDGDGEDSMPDLLLRYTAITIMAATVLPIQAVTSAKISYLTAGGAPSPTVSTPVKDELGAIIAAVTEVTEPLETVALGDADDDTGVRAITAAGPIAYPADYFAAPTFAGPTPIRVLAEDAGGVCRVEGHLATWDQCHVSFTNECVLAPHSRADYRYFMTGQLPLAEGGYQAVGTITLDARHADRSLGQLDAAAHYDHTGLAAAYVTAGEDKYGIWVSGVLAPGLSTETATKFAGASLSGDWRRVGGHLELIAALCVNVPGFPIAKFAGGVQTALVAAGYGPEARERRHLSAMFDSLDDRVQERLAVQDRTIADLAGQLERLAAQSMPLVREHLAARLAAAVTPAAEPAADGNELVTDAVVDLEATIEVEAAPAEALA